MGRVRLNLVGQRFGKLEVVSFVGLDARNISRWLCRCECGQERVHTGANLKRGNIVSCGCRRFGPKVDRLAESHSDFRVFCGMLSRCHNPATRNFSIYGGRGIVVCDRWRQGGFWVFNADMGDRPTADHSIDRIDNDGPYSPENCRWATAKEQGRNRRTNIHLTHDGITLTMPEWAERTGVNYKTLKSRIRKGWSVEKALDPSTVDRGVPDELAERVRAARSSGMTMRAVADECGVSVSTVHKLCAR